MGPSHGWVVLIREEAGPTRASAAGVRRSDQMRVGSPERVPSLFHANQRPPPASVNGLGSMEPPRLVWHRNGAADRSTNGPWGDADTAREMHCWPVERWRVA